MSEKIKDSEEFYLNHLSKLPHIFCGSFALNKFGYLNREVSDYDIILEADKYPEIDVILDSVPHKSRQPNYRVKRFKIVTVVFPDKSKMDLFFREDFESLETIADEQGFQYLTVTQ